MAITIAHKQEAVGEGDQVLTAIYNFMNGLPARFTIIDSDNIGADPCWFVFELAGGTGWQCWIGGRDDAATTWLAANSFDAAVPDTLALHVAFSPRGGWNVGVDGPDGTMFSNAPAEGAGAAGDYWLKIRNASTGIFFTAGELHWFTIWDDPAEGFFALLVDQGRDNSWDQGFGIFPIDSRFPAVDDDKPYVVLCGRPRRSGASDWLYAESTDTTYSGMLRPGDAGSPPTDCKIRHEPFRILDAQTQPDPINGNYDLDAIGIFTKSAGAGHSRGYIKPAYLRQSQDSDAARTTYNSGSWVVPYLNARIVLPWDNSPF